MIIKAIEVSLQEVYQNFNILPSKAFTSCLPPPQLFELLSLIIFYKP